MDRKSWKEWMNGSHSIYLILPFAALFGKGALFTVCLGIAALGLLLAEIAAGFLSPTVGGVPGKVSSLLCCLLPMLTVAHHRGVLGIEWAEFDRPAE